MHIEHATNAKPSRPQKTADEILAELKQDLGDWAKWTKSRKKSASPEPLRKLISKNTLFWGLSTSQTIHQPLIVRLLLLKSRPAKKDPPFDFAEATASWLKGAHNAQTAGEATSISYCLEAIAWAHALPALISRLDGEDEGGPRWMELVAFLLALTQPSQRKSPATSDESTSASGDVPNPISGCEVTDFLLTVELALTLAHVLPNVSLCKSRRQQGGEQFSNLIDALLDGEGMPHGRHLGDIQFLLASCIRCLVLDSQAKKHRIAKSARLQFDWLTRQTLRYARPTGANMLGGAVDSPYFDEMVKHATKLTKDESDVAAFQKLRGKRVAAGVELPPTSEHSEWSELAIMRASWSPASPSLAVSYGNRCLSAELIVGQETVFSGSCDPRVVVDGKQLGLVSDWEEVCWETDDDLDYLELEATLEKNWRVQRQFVLARRDQFALIADAITGPESAYIEYQHTLPIVNDIAIEQSEENTEAVILGRKKIGPIIPLALSEWKSSQGDGRLREEPARLELSARGDALYAPLFFSLNPALRNKPLTWRQLCVAENLLTVPKDVAVAYRIQVGKSQWVLYSSLGKPGNRTFLGLNIVSDFYLARFQSDGEPELIIDVEPN